MNTQNKWIPAVATDIRFTWARFCPMWAERVKSPMPPLPVASVQTHRKPSTLLYTG